MATRTRLASAAALLAAVSLVSAPVAAASPAPTAGPAPVTAERASTQLEAAPAGIADTSKRIFCERWGLFCG
ncbi:hypothetical protein [uncultured Micrococcus sp.]|uniref:hypothetical protein n=1 Tax=uncultured Micrococcus sp. TaxID=114051 RepID=UPI0025EAFD68|nr:hypothetical protein [uncultured Micrococcus sp.]